MTGAAGSAKLDLPKPEAVLNVSGPKALRAPTQIPEERFMRWGIPDLDSRRPTCVTAIADFFGRSTLEHNLRG